MLLLLSGWALTGLCGRSFSPDLLENLENDLHGRAQPLRHQLLQPLRVRFWPLLQQREDLPSSRCQLIVDRRTEAPARYGFRSFLGHFE